MLYANEPTIYNGAGIYIHIPFCHSKCGYCDFFSETNLSFRKRFIESLCTELSIRSEKTKSIIFDTIYFGGGTPSLLKLYELESIFSTLNKYYKMANPCEITFEINPGTISALQFREYLKMGINRLSIGIQSFDSRELQFLQRSHTKKQNIEVLNLCREEGFDNINIDLIYAFDGQTENSWLSTLHWALQYNPEHISAYNLTIEFGTPFYYRFKNGSIKKVPEREEIHLYHLVTSLLHDHRYEQYEISNFALNKKYSHHNLKYWNHIPYLGFGPSAHSFWDQKRFSNISSISKYISKLQMRLPPVNFSEDISKEKLMFEHIFLCLRKINGINFNHFQQCFEQDFLSRYNKTVTTLVKNDLASYDDHHFRLTQKGLLVSNEITPLFLEY